MARIAPITRAMSWIAGNDWQFDFVIFQPGSTTLRENITGWPIQWVFKEDVDDPDQLILRSTVDAGGGAAEIEITDGPEGEGTVKVPAEITNPFAAIDGAHSLFRSAGVIADLLNGPAELQRTASSI